MNRFLLSALALALILGIGAIPASAQYSDSASAAQPAPAAKPVDNTPPSYDMKAQALLDLETANKKFVALAEAIPQEKFTWRPGEGTRSFAEVFLHVAGERYFILGLGGAPAPAGWDPKNYETSTTDKAKIIEQLNKTWTYTQSVIDSMTNADFAKLLPKLGPQANAGDVIYILVADAHEHMGQSIAYARIIGVAPPWTVAAQKAAAEKKAKEAKQ